MQTQRKWYAAPLAQAKWYAALFRCFQVGAKYDVGDVITAIGADRFGRGLSYRDFGLTYLKPKECLRDSRYAHVIVADSHRKVDRYVDTAIGFGRAIVGGI